MRTVRITPVHAGRAAPDAIADANREARDLLIEEVARAQAEAVAVTRAYEELEADRDRWRAEATALREQIEGEK